MKKSIYIVLVLVLAFNFGVANVPIPTQQRSTPLSSQELSSIYGGEDVIYCDKDLGICMTADYWLFSITVCFDDPWGLCSDV